MLKWLARTGEKERERETGKKKLVMLSRLSKGDQNAPRRVKLKMKQTGLAVKIVVVVVAGDADYHHHHSTRPRRRVVVKDDGKRCSGRKWHSCQWHDGRSGSLDVSRQCATVPGVTRRLKRKKSEETGN